MLFVSFEYASFLLIAYIANYFLKNKSRYIVLLTLNLFFISKFGLSSLITIICLVLLTYVLGLFLMKNKSKKNLIISVVLVLSMMIFNKYTNFILSNIFNIDEVKMFVAIGISFYTFMSVSYLVDIYKSNIKAEKSLLYLSFYLTFFPHVLQGPITKSREFMSQIKGEFVYCEHRCNLAS